MIIKDLSQRIRRVLTEGVYLSDGDSEDYVFLLQAHGNPMEDQLQIGLHVATPRGRSTMLVLFKELMSRELMDAASKEMECSADLTARMLREVGPGETGGSGPLLGEMLMALIVPRTKLLMKADNERYALFRLNIGLKDGVWTLEGRSEKPIDQDRHMCLRIIPEEGVHEPAESPPAV